MPILSEQAIEGYKQYTERTLAYAEYKLGETWNKVLFNRKERLADGKIAVYFPIIPQASDPVTVSAIRLYDTGGKVWAEKTENIEIENVQEGVLYRFTFDLREYEESGV